jgi:hypothetical protein
MHRVVDRSLGMHDLDRVAIQKALRQRMPSRRLPSRERLFGTEDVLRHAALVVEPGILVFERGDHREDRHPVLVDLRAARGEGAAVVDAIDRQGDSPRRVAGAQEVPVHRMGHAIVAGRPVRGDDGLGQHLAPKMRPVGIGWEIPVKMSSVVRASPEEISRTSSISATGSVSPRIPAPTRSPSVIRTA